MAQPVAMRGFYFSHKRMARASKSKTLFDQIKIGLAIAVLIRFDGVSDWWVEVEVIMVAADGGTMVVGGVVVTAMTGARSTAIVLAEQQVAEDAHGGGGGTGAAEVVMGAEAGVKPRT